MHRWSSAPAAVSPVPGFGSRDHESQPFLETFVVVLEDLRARGTKSNRYTTNGTCSSSAARRRFCEGHRARQDRATLGTHRRVAAETAVRFLLKMPIANLFDFLL